VVRYIYSSIQFLFVRCLLCEADVQTLIAVRHTSPKLTSAKIFAKRSAIPAVISRVLPPSRKKFMGPSVNCVERTRLLRIGKRPRRGPFNSVMDPTEVGAGSALLEITEAVKESGKHDVWSDRTDTEHANKLRTGSHPRSLIELPAVVEPHQGTSYNPPVSAHQELLRTAHEIEERRVQIAEKHKEIQEKIALARQPDVGDVDKGLPTGMKLDSLQDEPAPEGEQAAGNSDVIMVTRPIPERKTRQQRKKAEKQRAEKRALAEKIAKRRLHSSVVSAKSLLKSLNQSTSSRQRARVQKQLLLKEKLKRGMGGQKFGKHVVKEGDIDVQLGEDLSESLRALKPEGNLFRDRFISMQHRALVEPRAPVQPTKTRVKFRETEKYAWKRFD